jgi:excinuclease UvrABC nuclease subunit
MIFNKWKKAKRKLDYEHNSISLCLSDCVSSVDKNEYHNIRQLVDRFYNGERTDKIYHEIMVL